MGIQEVLTYSVTLVRAQLSSKRCQKPCRTMNSVLIWPPQKENFCITRQLQFSLQSAQTLWHFSSGVQGNTEICLGWGNQLTPQLNCHAEFQVMQFKEQVDKWEKKDNDDDQRVSLTEKSGLAEHSEEKTEMRYAMRFFAPAFKHQFLNFSLISHFLFLSGLQQSLFLSLQLNILPMHWGMHLLQLTCRKPPVQTCCCLP